MRVCKGWRIEEDVIGLDGCLIAYIVDYTSRAAASLLDFANAVPSLSHVWLFVVTCLRCTYRVG